MSLVNFIELPNLGDERGGLVAIESNKNIPFEVKRIYYIFDTQNKPRGFHAHKELKQVMFCLKGQCNVILDNGSRKEQVTLTKANQGLVIDPMIWHEMHDFSEDCVLLVLASEHYDESDYIRDYEVFLKYTRLDLLPYDKDFLEKSWDWLNDEEIKSLTMTPSFTREQQITFFNRLPYREDYIIWGISYENVKIGACGLKNINHGEAELWLYIGNKEYWGKKLGNIVISKLEKIAIREKISKLYLTVSLTNERAIKLYKNLGYSIQQNLDNVYVMEKNL